MISSRRSQTIESSMASIASVEPQSIGVALRGRVATVACVIFNKPGLA